MLTKKLGTLYQDSAPGHRWGTCTDFLQAGCPSCHQNECQITDPNHYYYYYYYY